MKRLALLCVYLLIALSLTLLPACSGRSGQTQELPSSSDDPVAKAAELAYPQVLPQGAAGSEAVKLSLQENAVILGPGIRNLTDAATGREIPEAFIEAVNQGKDSRLAVYSFYSFEDYDSTIIKRCQGWIFEYSGGELSVCGLSTTDN